MIRIFSARPNFGGYNSPEPAFRKSKENTRLIIRDLRLFCEVARKSFFSSSKITPFQRFFQRACKSLLLPTFERGHWERKGSQLVDYSVFKTNNQPGLLTIIGQRLIIDTSKCPDDFRSAHKPYELAWDEMLDQFLSNPKSVEDEFFEPKKLKVLCLKNRRTECILYWLIFCVLSIRGHHE